MPWYRVCTIATFISKGSYENGEPKKEILVSVQKAHFALRACKLPDFMQRHIRADSANLRKFGATFRHGTVFAP